ncbi:hypothetical protein V8D89_005112 [Ganoderma adspersum]
MDPAGGRRTGDLDFHLNAVRRASTDMRDENLRLRAENERLGKLVSEVVPELKILRKERVALKAAIWALLRQSGAMPLLVPVNDHKLKTFEVMPYEILRLIFDFAVAQLPFHFDPSIQLGAHNPWLQNIRTKKAFPLISRTTFWQGMSVLYGEIVFRRMGQVSALAETLCTADVGPRLGSLIKSIRWESCVVAAPCADALREDLTFIFGQCTQLQSFSYHPHPNFPLKSKTPDHPKWEEWSNPLWFFLILPPLSHPPLLHGTAVSNLRLLDMQVDFKGHSDLLQAVHGILPTLKALESLILGCWPPPPWPLPEELTGMPMISLPSLNHLRIFAPEGAAETYICSRWNTPQLTRLTVLLASGWSPTRLLEKFGRLLRYLHLYPTRTNIRDPLAYAPALKACSALSSVSPHLEHLIVPRLLDTTSYPLLINSPTLIHLDLWASATDPASSRRQDRDQAVLNREVAVSPGSTVPSLRTVRCLFTRDEDPRGGPWRQNHSHTRHPDWPWICHPRLLPTDSDAVLYHHFAQGRVAQTVAALIPQDLGELTWKGNEFAYGWPAVYEEEDEELLKRMDDEYEASVRRDKRREALGLETSVSDWSSNSGELAEGESVDILDETDVVGGRDRFKVFRSEYVSLWGFPWDQPEEGEEDEDQDQDQEDEEDEEEEDADSENEEDEENADENEGQEGGEAEQVEEGRENGEGVEGEEEQEKHEMKKELTPKQLEAAAELVSPEYPVAQLDRAAVLSAFRRSRDRESYNHVNIWDHY